MVDDYGYINARIRGMKARLLDEKVYNDLLNQPDLDSLITVLKNTPYGQALARMPKTENPIDGFIHALREDLETTFQKLLKISSGKPNELFKILLMRYDIENLLILIRGKIQGIPEREIRNSLMPAFIFDRARLNELVAAKDASEVIDILGTWTIELPLTISRELVRAVREKNLHYAEYLIEESFYNWAISNLSDRDENERIVKSILQRLIDIRNIVATLIMLKDGLKPLGRIHYLSNGTLSPRVLTALENSDSLEQGYEVLKNTPYGKVLREGRKIDSITDFERHLEKLEVESVINLKRGDPLGIGIGASYIFAKESEVTNLRIIAYGINFGLSKPEIRDKIVIYQ